MGPLAYDQTCGCSRDSPPVRVTAHRRARRRILWETVLGDERTPTEGLVGCLIQMLLFPASQGGTVSIAGTYRTCSLTEYSD